MLNYNIDRADSAYNTAAPFQRDSKLQLGSMSIPFGMIQAIRIGCKPGVKLPVRLSAVSIAAESPSCCVVQLSDSYNVLVGTCRLWLASASAQDIITKAVLDTDGALLGHMSFNKALPAMLIAAARLAGGTVQTKAPDFTLLPECFIPWASGHARVLQINGTKTLRSVTIKPKILTRAEYAQGTYSISVIGLYNSQLRNNYICKLTVDNVTEVNGISLQPAQTKSFWVGGRHLVLRSGLTSNLRVVCDGSSITLKGVSDG